MRHQSTNGTIHISYAYCHRPATNLEEPQEVFHTRQLSYPVLVTVYHMLECHGMDILPYTPDMVSYLPDTSKAEPPLRVQDPEDWSIFSIEVRNTYGIPFEVTFETGLNGMSECGHYHCMY
jgi:trafficking protein particle complex subunit 9